VWEGMYFFGPTAQDPSRASYMMTDHETERARYWLPCVDLPTIRTTAEFRITSAARHEAYANGAKISQRSVGCVQGQEDSDA
jgi:aminopeptidase N